MRVPDAARLTRHTQEIGRAQVQLHDVQLQIASGRRVERLSDDPTAISVLERVRDTLREAESFEQNLAAAGRFIDTEEATLGSIQERLHHAVELGVTAGNPAVDASLKDQLADEVDILLTEIVGLGNTRVGDTRIFAGARSLTAPFESSGEPITGVAYLGDDSQTKVTIGKDSQVAMTTPGSRLAQAGGGLFDNLVALRDVLRNPGGLSETDHAAAIAQATEAVRASDNDVGVLRANAGLRQQRVAEAEDRLFLERERVEIMRSKLEDIDIAEKSVELAKAEQALQAAISVTSRSLQRPSLIDLLG